MVRRDVVQLPQIAIARVERQTTIGAHVGSKYMQEYMYPGGRIVRAPSVFLGPELRYYTDPRGDNHFTYDDGLAQQSIQGKTAAEMKAMGIKSLKEGLPRRSVESNFLITINPNRKWGADGHDPIVKVIFGRTLTQLTSYSEFLSILKVPATTKQTPTRPDFSGHYKNDALNFTDVISNTDIKGVIEVGDKQKRMHAHLVVEIKHYSMLQINKLLVKNLFLTIWNKICEESPGYRVYALRKGPYIDVQLLKQKNAMEIVKAYMEKSLGGTSNSEQPVDDDAGGRAKIRRLL